MGSYMAYQRIVYVHLRRIAIGTLKSYICSKGAWLHNKYFQSLAAQQELGQGCEELCP